MAIRNSAKALVVYEGKLLLNRCTSRFGTYYALPGGGQREGELLTEAVCREVLEETGLTVAPMRMSAIFERVSHNYDGASGHKMYFIFLCRYRDEIPRVEPTERDAYQIGVDWMNVQQVKTANLFPRVVRDNIQALLTYGETLYLGSERRG